MVGANKGARSQEEIEQQEEKKQSYLDQYEQTGTITPPLKPNENSQIRGENERRNK